MHTNPRTAEPLPPPPATFHFIGIGGIGMSGLARILTMWGYKVTGSDAMESAQTQSLRAIGIPVVIGHDDPSFASLADIVVTNKRAAANAATELDAATAAGARIIKRGDLLGMAANERFSIAVAGSHGKSTTSGILSVALRTLEADPTFAVGAIVAATGTNAEPGNGEHFVVEADEFDRSFHGLFPNVAIITSVAFDHPDIYDDQDDYDESFVEFVRNIKPDGTLVIAGDDDGCKRVIESVNALRRPDLHVQTFGERPGLDWVLKGNSTARMLVDLAGNTHTLNLRVPGKHNARNAVAAIAALHAAGFEVADAVRGVESFSGIGRRFEHKGEYNGVTVIDDYAHHPEEVTAVLNAAREHFDGKRIVAVHQPHTYTRTHALMDEFAASLDLAHDIVLMEIYGVGEVNEFNISSADMAAKMHKSVTLVDSVDGAVDAVKEMIGTDMNAVVMTIGAGTVTNVGSLLVDDQPIEGKPKQEPVAKPGRIDRGTPGKLGDLDVMHDAPMSLYTTLRIGGTADCLVRAATPDELANAVIVAHEHNLPVTVIGGGSNLLVHDNGIRGMVIVARVPGARADSQVSIEQDGDTFRLVASAMVPSSWLGKLTVDRGIGGLDWLIGLPGQLGGALVNNAGAHGREIKDSLESIEILHLDGTRSTEDASWLQSEYRNSRLKSEERPRRHIVLGASFQLNAENSGLLNDLAAHHAEFRRTTQPTGACSGSLFANPHNDHAARLIERAGLKGYRVGAMELSPVHANWMINTGGGTAEDAWKLVEIARASVRDSFGVDLTPEIERVGEWVN